MLITATLIRKATSARKFRLQGLFFFRKRITSNIFIFYIEKLKQIWEQRELTVVEGEKTRMGVGNDLFDNAKRIHRILGPAENAFSHYDEILATILEKVPQDELVLLALGPTATILAYDLFRKGYQAVDIGHVDISYEWFLRGVRDPSERIVIPGKYTNEVRGGNVVDACLDEAYLSQIIATVGLRTHYLKKGSFK